MNTRTLYLIGYCKPFSLLEFREIEPSDVGDDTSMEIDNHGGFHFEFMMYFSNCRDSNLRYIVHVLNKHIGCLM